MDNLAKLMAILQGMSIEKLRLILRFAEFLVEKGEEIKYGTTP